jgi:hypothetical protein
MNNSFAWMLLRTGREQAFRSALESLGSAVNFGEHWVFA